MQKLKAKLFLFLVTFAVLASGDPTGLQLSASADLVSQFNLYRSNASNRLDVREAEIMVFAPIDHYFDGRLSLAAHYEAGELNFEVHETTIGSSKLIPRSRFRIGQYFLGVGRLNQFHRHDWPFITAPKVHRSFFGQEGLLDTGVEYSYLTPLPFYLDLTGGITNGWNLGHSHTQGNPPRMPTHYLRAVTYFNLPWNGGTQIGLNYLGRTDNTGRQTLMTGFDITAKWNDNGKTTFLLQTEAWYRRNQSAGLQPETNWGFYIFPQAYIGYNLYFGPRIDYYTNGTDDVDPNAIFDFYIVPTVSWRPSEFSVFRLAYNFMQTQLSGQSATNSSMIEFQAVFILGTHPAHDF
jgi:hypothetical protein